MMSYDLEQAQQYHQELRRQAQHHRLVRYVKARHGSPTTTLLAWAGKRLISLGERLQPHQAPAYPYPLAAHEHIC